MEVHKEEAAKWLEAEQSEHKCSVDIQNGSLLFTVASDTNPVSFTVNHDHEVNSWSVWSEHPGMQEHLGQILEFCESSKAKSIVILLEKIFKSVNKIIKQPEEDGDDDNDEDDDDGYYDYNDEEDDVGIAASAPTKPDPESEESDDEDARFFGGGVNASACQRLMTDLKSMMKEAHKFCIEGSPRGNNLFLWDVKLTGFPTDTRLGKDLTEWARKYQREPVVYLEMQFPGDYPMKPPFVRVIRPRFKFLTGHVTIGGSICMEMLTSTGWTPTNDIESILVQIRSEIMSDPNTRLDANPDRAYGETEARDAFNRMVTRYGWN